MGKAGLAEVVGTSMVETGVAVATVRAPEPKQQQVVPMLLDYNVPLDVHASIICGATSGTQYAMGDASYG